MKAIAVEKRECPNCHTKRGFKAFDCQNCQKGFCGNCFIALPEDDGNTVKCPHCKTVLTLPKLKK